MSNMKGVIIMARTATTKGNYDDGDFSKDRVNQEVDVPSETGEEIVTDNEESVTGKVDEMLSASKYFKEGANSVETSWNKELAVLMTVNDTEYFNSLDADTKISYQAMYDTWVETHQQGVIGYTDEQLSHIQDSNTVSTITAKQAEYRDSYLASYGYANPEKSEEMALTPDNKYYLESDNPVTQKMYDEMALIMTYNDKDYMATLPEAQQQAITTSVIDWSQTHSTYQCFGTTDEMISHIPDSNSVKAIKANSDKVRDEYLTAMAEKYPEEDIQSKIDDNTPEVNTPESNGSEPKSFWGNIKSNVSGFFSKAREVVSKTTIGAYILSKYDAVKDWVKGKLNPDYEAETQTAENEPVKTEEDKTQERADMANAELPNFDENAENQEQCEA